MHDKNEDETRDNSSASDPTPEVEEGGRATYDNADEIVGDQTGAFADFIRQQPIIMLSVAFGLGLLATSLLARRRS
jgi:hypothetical protein